MDKHLPLINQELRRKIGFAVMLSWSVLLLLETTRAVSANFFDFYDFYTAGHLVGTSRLEDLASYQRGHLVGAFAYMPAFAYCYLLPSRAPILLAYGIHTVVLVVLGGLVATLLASLLHLKKITAMLLSYAWTPLGVAIYGGQNSPLGLLLAVALVMCLQYEAPLTAGAFCALLLYKPTYGAFFVFLLAVKGQWKSLAMVGTSLPLWYLTGVSATGINWTWPVTWLHMLEKYRLRDALSNKSMLVGIPSLLERCGISFLPATLFAAVLLIFAVPTLRKRPLLESFVLLCSLLVALGPHTLFYDVLFLLPPLFWLIASASRLSRSIVILAYLLSALSIFSKQIHVNPLLLVTCVMPLWLMREFSLKD